MTDEPGLPPPPRPRGAVRRGQILQAAFDLYRRTFLPFVAIAAVVSIPLSLLEAYVSAELLTPLEVQPGETPVIDERFWRAIGVALLSGVIASIILYLATGALTRAAVLGVAERRPTVGATYAFAIRRAGSILLIAILTTLLVTAGIIALVIPGIFFLVRTLLAMPAFVLEGVRGRNALRRSWNLVRGDGWTVFGMWVLATVAATLVSALVTAPFDPADWPVFGLAAGTASALTTPYVTAVIVYVYLDLRARKEGLDRDGLVLELTGEPPPPPGIPPEDLYS